MEKKRDREVLGMTGFMEGPSGGSDRRGEGEKLARRWYPA